MLFAMLAVAYSVDITDTYSQDLASLIIEGGEVMLTGNSPDYTLSADLRQCCPSTGSHILQLHIVKKKNPLAITFASM